MIGFQSGGHLITGWAGEFVRRSDARVYADEAKNHTGYISTEQRQPVSIRWSSCKKKKRQDDTRWDETRRDETKPDEIGGDRTSEDPVGPREKATSLLEAEPRAYDIKHYNYYLNSSRIAPGVAALLFTFAASLSLSSSLVSPFLITLFPLLPLPFLRSPQPPPPPQLPPPPPPLPLPLPQPLSATIATATATDSFSLSLSIHPARMAAQPRAFCSRIDTGRSCVPILLLFELALLLLRPRVGATLGVPPLRRQEKP